MMFKKKEFATEADRTNKPQMREEDYEMNDTSNDAETENIVKQWQRDAEQLKLLVPDFSLETAIANLKEKETFCLADFQLSNFGDRVAGEKIANREEDNAYVTSALGVESLFAGHVAGVRNRSL